MLRLRFRAQQSHEAHSPWSKRAEKGSSARRRLSSTPIGGPISEPELHEIAESSSQSERAAAEAERELLEWKKLKFMEQRVGEDFDGLIVSVTKFGFFVELTELFIEGLVPLNSLADDNYSYHENTRQIIGARSKKTYSIGDKVRVIVDRIDHMQRKVQFAVMEDKAQARRQAAQEARIVRQPEPRTLSKEVSSFQPTAFFFVLNQPLLFLGTHFAIARGSECD